jgi:hypothetical protein
MSTPIPHPSSLAAIAPFDADGAPRRFFGPDLERSRLRAIVEALGVEVRRLEAMTSGGGAPATLTLRFGDLEKVLALGAEPDVRTCPVCGTVGMKRATVCGNCWSPLTPPP